ncbi:hypothetical protein [Ralstonia pseudosolanacearum]
MKDRLERLEVALGGKLERNDARVVPGATSIEGVEIVYFSDDGKNNFRKQFESLTMFANPPQATSGGVNERGCKITTPNGVLFHAIGYHGDVDGWREDIETGAKGLQILLRMIDGDRFVVKDGESFRLRDCKIEFS